MHRQVYNILKHTCLKMDTRNYSIKYHYSVTAYTPGWMTQQQQLRHDIYNDHLTEREDCHNKSIVRRPCQYQYVSVGCVNSTV